MSADFAQSETRLNLMRAFAGESQARNRYTFAAGLARRKNLYVLESVFTFTADRNGPTPRCSTTCWSRCPVRTFRWTAPTP